MRPNAYSTQHCVACFEKGRALQQSSVTEGGSRSSGAGMPSVEFIKERRKRGAGAGVLLAAAAYLEKARQP